MKKKILSLVLIFVLSLNVFSPICNANYPDDVFAQIEEFQQKLDELKQKQKDQQKEFEEKQKTQQQQPIQVELKQYNPSFFERTSRIFKSALSWLAGIGSFTLLTGYANILFKSFISWVDDYKCHNFEDFVEKLREHANRKTFFEPIKFTLGNVYFKVNA